MTQTYNDRLHFNECHANIPKDEFFWYNVAIRYEEMAQLINLAKSDQRAEFEKRISHLVANGWGSTIGEADKLQAVNFLIKGCK